MTSSWSIRRRLVMIVLAITSIVVAATVVITLQTNAATVQGQREAALLAQSQGYARQLDEQLRSITTTPRLIAAMLEDPSLTPIPRIWRTVSHIMLDQPLIARVGILRPFRDGYEIVRYRQPTSVATVAPMWADYVRELPGDVWITRSLTEGIATWSDVETAGNNIHSILAIPYTSTDVRAQGVVWIEIDAYALRQTIQSIVQPNPGESYHVVLSSSGSIVGAYGLPASMADRSGAMALGTAQTQPLTTLLNEMSAAGVMSLEAVDPMQIRSNAPSFITQHILPFNNWRLVTVYAPQTLQSPQNQSALFVLLLGASGLVLLVVVVRNMVKNLISDPLMTISAAAQEIGSGDMRYHIEHTERGDEVGALARALESMQRNLADTYGRLSLYGRTLEQRVVDRTKELEQARELAQDNAAELRSLYDASIEIVSEYHLDVMLQKLIAYVRTLLRAGYCTVWLLNEENRQLRLVATTPEYSHVVGVVVTANEGIAGRVIRSRKPIIVEDYANWSGRIAWIMPQMHRAVAVPLIYSGKAIGAVVVGRGPLDRSFDETDQRLLNLLANVVSPIVRNAQLFEQLEQAIRKAELANEVKTRFLASITHELRTPLNLVINNMDFMRIGTFGDVNEEQRERLDQTIRSAEHLLYLINDLLDVSKIEAGEMQIFIQPTDLYPILIDTLDAALAMLPENSPVALLADFPEALPPILMDARRIRQVLLNLLGNAIKFTKQGEIWFRVHVHTDFVEFIVSDTGMGIPEEELEGIFQPFERTKHAKQQGIEGTGLGLPISRYFVQAHGGELHVETEVGRGSIFSFALPIAPPEKRRTSVTQAVIT